jgi:hypothetical protein
MPVLTKIITAATDSVIANLPLRPTRVKRHLSREKEWSILGYGPIVRVVHRLTPWYDRRDDQSAVITAACDGTLSARANGRSPARSSHDLFPYFGDDCLTRAEKSAPAERSVALDLHACHKQSFVDIASLALASRTSRRDLLRIPLP